jgi:hypothetical protein
MRKSLAGLTGGEQSPMKVPSTTLVNPAHLEELLDDLHQEDPNTLMKRNFFVITDGLMTRTAEAKDTYNGGPQRRFNVDDTCKGTLEVLNRWKDKIGNFFVTVLSAKPEEFQLRDIPQKSLDEQIKPYQLNPVDIKDCPCLMKPVNFKNIFTIWNHFLSLLNPSEA